MCSRMGRWEADRDDPLVVKPSALCLGEPFGGGDIIDIEVTVKNYRCFPETHPGRIVLSPGFTAFLGVNNSGKSSMLRFFYEFRQMFQLATDNSSFVRWLLGQPNGIAFLDVE